MEKPFSPSCERNKGPILEVLQKLISPEDKFLLEIGSGTGQHAVHFAPHFKNLKWVTSDRFVNFEGIKAWLQEAKIPNILGPVQYEVGKSSLPPQRYDLVFTANTLHIMSWKKVKTLVKQLGQYLVEGTQIIIYGPFNFNNEFTSESNRIFDEVLKHNDPKSGIRNFEDLVSVMNKNEIEFTEKFDMPANNFILVFTKIKKIK